MKIPLKPKTEYMNLKDQIDLPKLLGRFYEKGENVEWAAIRHSRWKLSAFKALFYTVSIAVLIATFMLFDNNLEKKGIILLLSYFVISLLVIIIWGLNQKKVCHLITSKRVLKIDRSAVTHRSLNSIYSSKKEGDDLVFYDRVLHEDSQKFETREIFRFKNVNGQAFAHQQFYKVWGENGPFGKLEETIDQVMILKGFQREKDFMKPDQLGYTGELNGLSFSVEIDGLFPVNVINFKTICTNKENSFLVLFGQNTAKLAIEDLQINDQQFDNSFIIQSDSHSLMEHVLSDRTKQLLLNCIGSAECRYQYGRIGKITKEKRIGTQSQFSDQEDVLDFQLLERKTNKEASPLIKNSTMKGKPAFLTLSCIPEDSVQFNFEFLERLLKNCIDSVAELGKEIEQYNKFL